MTVPIVEGAIAATYEGETYYFCAPGCRKAFLAGPAGGPGASLGGLSLIR